eukprot:m.167611 g.167611  ORF g.167611 m.167611 type:complete len:372 (+) comp21131_c0_seq6:1021-2136(+)
MKKVFVIGGHNNREIVAAPLLAKGWTEITDLQTPEFTLKWVEIRRDINFDTFREGKQLINRNPHISCLAVKSKLVESLRALARTLERKGEKLDLHSFLPATYLLSDARERAEFFKAAEQAKRMWICKPIGANQGKGIFLVTDVAEFKKEYFGGKLGHGERLVQLYLEKPLLLNRRKFDIRVYMLIASAAPFVVYYHDGYLRLSCEEYSLSDPTNLAAHLTNQYVQKKHPGFHEMKEDTVRSFDAFNAYVNDVVLPEKPDLGKDWVLTKLKSRMKEIMGHCFRSARGVLAHRVGLFDLLGFDFMVDEDMNVWLIEVNVNPALFTTSAVLKTLLPPMVEETLDIVLEINDKVRRRKPLGDVVACRTFEEIHRD